MSVLAASAALALLGGALKSVRKEGKGIDDALHAAEEFCRWFTETTGKTDLREVRREDVTGFLRHLRLDQSPATGKPLSVSSVRGKMSAVREMFRCLMNAGLLLVNPAREVGEWLIGLVEQAGAVL